MLQMDVVYIVTFTSPADAVKSKYAEVEVLLFSSNIAHIIVQRSNRPHDL